MIKTKIISLTLSESIGGLTQLDLETYLEDQIDLNSFYGATPWEGLDVVIMTKEEYEDGMSKNASLRKRLNEKEGEICKLIVANEEIQEEIKDLEEKMAQDAEEIDLHPDGIIVFRKKRISELEKEVEKLKEENKVLKEENKNLKNKGDEFSIKITGGLFYYKED